MGEPTGLVKVIADAKTDRLLGVHILAPHASDMIAECRWRRSFTPAWKILPEPLHAHPTLRKQLKKPASPPKNALFTFEIQSLQCRSELIGDVR